MGNEVGLCSFTASKNHLKHVGCEAKSALATRLELKRGIAPLLNGLINVKKLYNTNMLETITLLS